MAADTDILRLLSTLPEGRRQPNLLLAAVRLLFGTPANWRGFRRNLLAHAGAVRSLVLTHTTQTNEPGRCAALLPVLAQLPQPLALLEAGASAGLCLLPDFYHYDYGIKRISPEVAMPDAPVLSCSVSPGTPLPAAPPNVIWRVGLDLDPVDILDPTRTKWLETLVWPEQTHRLVNLRAALKIAAKVKPRVEKGDLLGDDLVRLCREAPPEASLVVFHTAVLGYTADRDAIQAFAKRIMGLSKYWIANESPRVFPDIARSTRPSGARGQFLVLLNGSPVAWSDPHGSSLEWIA